MSRPQLLPSRRGERSPEFFDRHRFISIFLYCSHRPFFLLLLHLLYLGTYFRSACSSAAFRRMSMIASMGVRPKGLGVGASLATPTEMGDRL